MSCYLKREKNRIARNNVERRNNDESDGNAKNNNNNRTTNVFAILSMLIWLFTFRTQTKGQCFAPLLSKFECTFYLLNLFYFKNIKFCVFECVKFLTNLNVKRNKKK